MQPELIAPPPKADASSERDDRTETVRFDDPVWDDEYCTWLDNGLRTCCS